MLAAPLPGWLAAGGAGDLMTHLVRHLRAARRKDRHRAALVLGGDQEAHVLVHIRRL